MSNPALVWLRKVVLAVNEAASLNQYLTATDLHDLCEDNDIEIPGLRPGTDEQKGKKVIGSIMGKLFRERDVVEVDGFNLTREEKEKPRQNPSDGGGYKSKVYMITRK